MAKRSKTVQSTIDRMNHLLSLSEMDIWMQDGKFVRLSSEDQMVQHYKDGICAVIEALLFETKSYKGYMYLDPENSNIKRFDRKYF